VGEGGQGGVSRRVCPVECCLEQYSPVKASVAEIRLKGLQLPLLKKSENARDNDEEPGNRCDAVRSGWGQSRHA